MSRTVLAVDDDFKILESIRLVLEPKYRIFTADSGEKALSLLAKKKIDLVFLDLAMPGMDGLAVLERIKETGENTAVVMVTANDSARSAVEALKRGAFDYLPKPFDPDALLIAAEKAIAHLELNQEVISFRSQVRPILFESLVGKSNAMKEVGTIIAKAAPTDATIVLEGETGTGKELVARAVHFASPRKDKPFIAINCAGIPENLLETEFFGYERGAFTGAERQKPGRFELAEGGTLFLDEISSLRLDLQGKILRAVESRQIERVGGTRTIDIDVRIITATNMDLKKLVQQQKFREDLYYRLYVVPISLPSLRERKEDIPLLVGHFLEIYNKRFNRRVNALSRQALERFMQYPWPGNVRELENVIERLVVLADGDRIDVSHLPFDLAVHAPDFEAMLSHSLILKDAVDSFEKKFITGVLERTRWNQSEAAKAMGIHRNTLILKKEQLGIKEQSGV